MGSFNWMLKGTSKRWPNSQNLCQQCTPLHIHPTPNIETKIPVKNVWIEIDVFCWQGNYFSCNWRHESQGRQRWVISLRCYVGRTRCRSKMQGGRHHCPPHQVESNWWKQVCYHLMNTKCTKEITSHVLLHAIIYSLFLPQNYAFSVLSVCWSKPLFGQFSLVLSNACVNQRINFVCSIIHDVIQTKLIQQSGIEQYHCPAHWHSMTEYHICTNLICGVVLSGQRLLDLEPSLPSVLLLDLEWRLVELVSSFCLTYRLTYQHNDNAVILRVLSCSKRTFSYITSLFYERKEMNQ